MFLDKEAIKKVRRITSELYDYPPAVWMQKTYHGDSDNTPKITDGDRCLLRYLYVNARYDSEVGRFFYETSVRGIAQRQLKDKTQIRRSLSRLIDSGAIEVEPSRGNLSRFYVKHFGKIDSEEMDEILEKAGVKNWD